jgi:predicted nucleotidyltransferase
MIPGIPDEYSLLIIDELRQADIQKAVVFGSRAKGNYKAGSDIDIALYGPITFEQLSTIDYAIKSLELPWAIDVVAMELITEVALKEHIKRVGMMVFEKG